MDVAALYLQVIRNVVEGVRADFSTEQLDENALRTLATLWEHKVLETGSLSRDSEEEGLAKSAAKKEAELPEGAASISAQEVQGNAEPPCLDGLPPQAVEEGNKKMRTSDDGKPDATAEASAAIASSSAVDKGETLSSDSDEDMPGMTGVDVQSSNLVLAQFEKVARAKSKWKCTLKEGVMTLNSKDVLFGKASGEFFWG